MVAIVCWQLKADWVKIDEPYGFPGDHQPDTTMLYVLIDIYHEFLLLFYYCVLLEIKLTTTTTKIGPNVWNPSD